MTAGAPPMGQSWTTAAEVMRCSENRRTSPWERSKPSSTPPPTFSGRTMRRLATPCVLVTEPGHWPPERPSRGPLRAPRHVLQCPGTPDRPISPDRSQPSSPPEPGLPQHHTQSGHHQPSPRTGFFSAPGGHVRHQPSRATSRACTTGVGRARRTALDCPALCGNAHTS